MTLQHTPGPWRWELNAKHRSLHLVGGRPKFDLTVMDFVRWGTHGATMRLRDTAHDGMQLLYRVHERADWIATEPGREHHRDWHQLLTHPDARLIQAAPDMLATLRKAVLALAYCAERLPEMQADYEAVSAAIADVAGVPQ